MRKIGCKSRLVLSFLRPSRLSQSLQRLVEEMGPEKKPLLLSYSWELGASKAGFAVGEAGAIEGAGASGMPPPPGKPPLTPQHPSRAPGLCGLARRPCGLSFLLGAPAPAL